MVRRRAEFIRLTIHRFFIESREFNQQLDYPCRSVFIEPLHLPVLLLVGIPRSNHAQTSNDFRIVSFAIQNAGVFSFGVPRAESKYTCLRAWQRI